MPVTCVLGVLTQVFNDLAITVTDRHFQRHLAGQGVRGAGHAGVVVAESHLDAVQQPFGDDRAFVDQRLRRLFDRHGDGGVVVGCAHDEVDGRQNAVLIRLVMMGQRAARRFHTADAFVWRVGDHHAHIRVGDFRVLAQFQHPFGGVEQLDQPRPVGGQAMMDGLVTAVTFLLPSVS